MRTLRRTLATAIPLCIALALLSSATACAGGWMNAGDSDGTPNGPTDWDSNGNARSDGLENVVSNFPEQPSQRNHD